MSANDSTGVGCKQVILFALTICILAFVTHLYIYAFDNPDPEAWLWKVNESEGFYILLPDPPEFENDQQSEKFFFDHINVH